jgi:hypothetical protein
MSKLFLLVMHQDGGCDYSIGCGTTVSTIHANSKEEAIESAIKLRKNWKELITEKKYEITDVLDTAIYVLKYSDTACDEISLYEISDKINLIPIITKTIEEIEKYQKTLIEKNKEENEFKKYQELKAKFEGNK